MCTRSLSLSLPTFSPFHCIQCDTLFDVQFVVNLWSIGQKATGNSLSYSKQKMISNINFNISGYIHVAIQSLESQKLFNLSVIIVLVLWKTKTLPCCSSFSQSSSILLGTCGNLFSLKHCCHCLTVHDSDKRSFAFKIPIVESH